MNISRWDEEEYRDGKRLFRRIPARIGREEIEALKKAEAVEDTVTLSGEPPQTEPKGGWGKAKGIFGIITLVAFFIVKFKTLFLILLTKGKALFLLLNLGKFLATASTMFLSIFVYAIFFGWLFALGFVVLLFLHEMGHAFVIKAKGLRAGAPLFIPMMGAVIMMKDQPVDAKTEAEIAYGGPAAGTIAATACYFISATYDSELMMALAYVGFFINMFNLAPVSPLDGGRIVTAISRKLWYVGMAVLFAMFLYTFNIILLLVLIMGGMRLYEVSKETELPESYYEVTPPYRRNMAIAYFGLLAYTGFMTMESLSHLHRATGL